jgi:hypothetical protein
MIEAIAVLIAVAEPGSNSFCNDCRNEFLKANLYLLKISRFYTFNKWHCNLTALLENCTG